MTSRPTADIVAELRDHAAGGFLVFAEAAIRLEALDAEVLMLHVENAVLRNTAAYYEQQANQLPGAKFTDLNERIDAALHVAGDYAWIDGGHHKQWVIDQMVRALTGPDYDDWVGDDEWDEGTLP